MTTDTPITLGAQVFDLITGFSGRATGRATYLTGCSQILVSPNADAGMFREPQWFDEQRLRADGDVPIIVLDNGTTPGCDKPAPKR